MTQLTDLIERLEKLEGPDAQVDADILMCIHPGSEWKPYRPRALTKWLYDVNGKEICYGKEYVPRFTRSLEAALTLVPEGMRFGVSGTQSNVTPQPKKYHGWVMPQDSCLADDEFEGWSDATPAIALMIAIMKARASAEGGG